MLNFRRAMASGWSFSEAHSSEARINFDAFAPARGFVFIYALSLGWLVTFIGGP
jgi:hypothetical protein